MKSFWKWFFIVLGALLLAGIVFCGTLFFIRGGVGLGMRASTLRGGFTPRMGMFGGMIGLGLLGLFFRMLVPLGVLVLAGFGVASLVKGGKKPATPPAAPAPVCASCGKTLAADWKTCPYCGTPVEHPEDGTPAK